MQARLQGVFLKNSVLPLTSTMANRDFDIGAFSLMSILEHPATPFQLLNGPDSIEGGAARTGASRHTWARIPNWWEASL